MVVCTIIFLISQRHNHGGMMQLLLAGIAINALCGSAIGVLSYVGDEQQLRQLTLWMMGNLGGPVANAAGCQHVCSSSHCSHRLYGGNA